MVRAEDIREVKEKIELLHEESQALLEADKSVGARCAEFLGKTAIKMLYEWLFQEVMDKRIASRSIMSGMKPDDVADLDSITIPSRKAARQAHERNQFQGGRVVVTIEEWSGHQEARIKEPHEYLEFSIRPREFFNHIDGETWPTKADAKTTVFEIDRYPDITYDREDELDGSEELEEAVAEVWSEMKERWWSETEFVDEINIGDGHTVAVHYEENEEDEE